jgi:hypothetical protein
LGASSASDGGSVTGIVAALVQARTESPTAKVRRNRNGKILLKASITVLERWLMRAPHLSAMLCAASLFGVWSRSAHAQAQNPDLSSGGLAPPPAVESQKAAEQPQAAPGDTEKDLALAEQEDAGRGLQWVWLDGGVGIGHFGFGTFDGGDLVDRDAVETTQTGLVADVGLGVRIVYFTVGARFRYAPLPDFRLWTIGAEGGLHIPLGSLEPYFTLGAHYVSVSPTEGTLDIGGFDGRLGAGIDYYLTNMFSVGANLTGDLLVLMRPKLDGVEADSVYAADGSSIGGSVALAAMMGLHF